MAQTSCRVVCSYNMHELVKGFYDRTTGSPGNAMPISSRAAGREDSDGTSGRTVLGIEGTCNMVCDS